MDERVEHVSRRNLDLLVTNPDLAPIPVQVFANVSQLSIRTRRSSEFNGPQRYSGVFIYPLMTSTFPHNGRPTGPDSAGVTTRRDAW